MSNETAFNEAVAASENVQKADIAHAMSTLSGDSLKTAIRSADRAHLSRVVAAGIASGIDAANPRAELEFFRTSDESFDSIDDTAMNLRGGRYFVSASGTFGEGGGSVTLVDADGFAHASFTEAGSATADLRFGSYNFVLTNVTDLVAGVKSAPYF